MILRNPVYNEYWKAVTPFEGRTNINEKVIAGVPSLSLSNANDLKRTSLPPPSSPPPPPPPTTYVPGTTSKVRLGEWQRDIQAQPLIIPKEVVEQATPSGSVNTGSLWAEVSVPNKPPQKQFYVGEITPFTEGLVEYMGEIVPYTGKDLSVVEKKVEGSLLRYPEQHMTPFENFINDLYKEGINPVIGGRSTTRRFIDQKAIRDESTNPYLVAQNISPHQKGIAMDIGNMSEMIIRDINASLGLNLPFQQNVFGKAENRQKVLNALEKLMKEGMITSDTYSQLSSFLGDEVEKAKIKSNSMRGYLFMQRAAMALSPTYNKIRKIAAKHGIYNPFDYSALYPEGKGTFETWHFELFTPKNRGEHWRAYQQRRKKI